MTLYREEPKRVAASAYLLLMPAVIAGAGLGALVDALRDTALEDRVAMFAAISALAGFLSTLGFVVYAALLDELVGARIRGRRLPSISAALRHLPFGRLIVADLLVAAILGITTAFLIVPGLVAICLLAIVGPVVNIERANPTAALRRSARLTWPHLGTVALTIVPALAVEELAHHSFCYLHEAHAWLLELLIGMVLVPTLGAYIGLAEVVLAYALLVRDPSSRIARELGSSPGSATR